MELHQRLQETITRRFQICQGLMDAFEIQRTPEVSCSDLPCHVACPLQEITGVSEAERRRCKRRVVQLPIVYGSRLENRAVTQDISMGGLRIKSGCTLPEGQSVFLRFSDQRDCVAEAVVVWRNGIQMGLKFTKMSGSFKFHVRRLLSAGR
jgi:hypothetical protein